MNYYVVETDKHKLIQKTAGVKARQDVETIFKWNNFKKIEIPCLIEGRENKTRLGKIKAHYDVYMLWKNALKKIKKNDWIYIQFPLLEHTMLFSLLIKNLEKRGIHTSIIIHDVEAIRFTLRNDVPLSRKIRMRFEEISSFKNCSKIIVHNEKMKSFMHEKWKIHKDAMAHMVADKISNGKIKVIYDIPKDNVFGYAEDTKMKLNSDKLQALGWTPEIGLEDAYKRMIEQMKIEEI